MNLANPLATVRVLPLRPQWRPLPVTRDSLSVRPGRPGRGPWLASESFAVGVSAPGVTRLVTERPGPGTRDS